MQEAQRETQKLIRELKQERDNDVQQRFKLATRDDFAYQTPSEVLDDVMDVDWNLMVNEVRVQWKQIQRSRIRDAAHAMAKDGKDPLDAQKAAANKDGKELIEVDESGTERTLIRKKGNITWKDEQVVPNPEIGWQFVQARHKAIKEKKFDETGKEIPKGGEEKGGGSSGSGGTTFTRASAGSRPLGSRSSEARDEDAQLGA